MQSVEGGILPQQMWLRLELVGRGFLQVWDCLDPEQNQVGCYIPPLERSGLILTEAVGKRGEAVQCED